MDDREATQKFMILNVLVEYTGQVLTPDKVEEITERLAKEIKEGACSWSFETAINEVK